MSDTGPASAPTWMTCPTCGTSWPGETTVCPADGTSLIPSPSAPMNYDDDPLPPGTMVGEYKIESQLGAGGMGEVYGARHPMIGKRVAVKVMNRHCSANPMNVDRFIQEAKAVNAIGHANIVDIFSFGKTKDGRCFFVMEWLRGESLRGRLDRAPMTLAAICDVLEPVLRALEAAHAAKIIHRDLKPDNIFLVAPKDGEPERVKLLDFGIAKLTHGEGMQHSNKTDTGQVVGTPGYMAPEQASGGRVEAASDIYCLGVVAFEMATGVVPFTAESTVQIMAMHVCDEPPVPSTLREVPPSVDRLLLRMLKKRPVDRPSIREIRDALPAIRAASQPVTAAVVTPKPEAVRAGTAPTALARATPEPSDLTPVVTARERPGRDATALAAPNPAATPAPVAPQSLVTPAPAAVVAQSVVTPAPAQSVVTPAPAIAAQSVVTPAPAVGAQSAVTPAPVAAQPATVTPAVVGVASAVVPVAAQSAVVTATVAALPSAETSVADPTPSNPRRRTALVLGALVALGGGVLVWQLARTPQGDAPTATPPTATPPIVTPPIATPIPPAPIDRAPVPTPPRAPVTTGVLVIDVQPRGATIEISGSPAITADSGHIVRTLAVGNYTITATARDHDKQTKTASLTGSQTVTIDLKLQKTRRGAIIKTPLPVGIELPGIGLQPAGSAAPVPPKGSADVDAVRDPFAPPGGS